MHNESKILKFQLSPMIKEEIGPRKGMQKELLSKKRHNSQDDEIWIRVHIIPKIQKHSFN